MHYVSAVPIGCYLHQIEFISLEHHGCNGAKLEIVFFKPGESGRCEEFDDFRRDIK